LIGTITAIAGSAGAFVRKILFRCIPHKSNATPAAVYLPAVEHLEVVLTVLEYGR
jgi:hypothetical protein